MQDQAASNAIGSRRFENVLCALSYITVLPAAIMLLLPPTARSSRVRFHACQSLLLNGFLLCSAFLLNLAAGFEELIQAGGGAGFQWAARIFCVTVWAIACICLTGGREFHVPGLAALAAREADAPFFKRIAGAAQGRAVPAVREAFPVSR